MNYPSSCLFRRPAEILIPLSTEEAEYQYFFSFSDGPSVLPDLRNPWFNKAFQVNRSPPSRLPTHTLACPWVKFNPDQIG